MYSRITNWITLLAAVALTSCGGGTAATQAPVTPPTGIVPKGSRLLEIQVNESAGIDFVNAFNLAQTVGMDSISLSLDWNGIDIGTDNTAVPPAPIYASDPAGDFLAIANSCYPNSNTRLSLMLRPVTTLTKMAPPGFENIRFDDPAMIDRFERFIDYVFAKIPDIDLTALAIGSEVDLYLQNDALRQEYLAFYEQVSDYARTAYAQLYPNKPPLRVAVEATHTGLLDASTKAYYQQLNQFSDVIGVSYYPLSGGLVQDPTVVASDFAAMIDSYPGKNLHFFQLGYPSGYYSTSAYPEYAAGRVAPSINSSDSLQAQFIDAVFAAWDAHAARIDLVGFTWMQDITEASVAEITANPAFGGLQNPPPDFVEFLRTLGLRTEAAADKPAWASLGARAAERGWTDTGFTLSCQ